MASGDKKAGRGDSVCGGWLVLRSLRRRRMPQNRGSIVRGAAKITQRIARRSGALPSALSAGAERLPAAAGFARFPILPKPSQTFPILSRGLAGVRITTLYRMPLCAAYAGDSMRGGRTEYNGK